MYELVVSGCLRRAAGSVQVLVLAVMVFGMMRRVAPLLARAERIAAVNQLSVLVESPDPDLKQQLQLSCTTV